MPVMKPYKNGITKTAEMINPMTIAHAVHIFKLPVGLTNYLPLGLVRHEDRRHFNPDQVCEGVENLVG